MTEKQHVIWIGIDPNLLLGGLDTNKLFGCDNYLKFNLNQEAEPKKDTNNKDEVDDQKIELDEDDVKEEVSSDNESFDDGMQYSFDQQMQDDDEDEDENEGAVEKKEPEESEEKHWNSEDSSVPPVVQGFINGRAMQGRGIRDHTKKDPSLKCDRCKKTFCLYKSLQRHKRIDACVEKGEGYKIPSAQPALCPECGTCFGDRSTMRKHIKMVHYKTKSHQCDQCEKAFVDRTNLKRHIETVHIKDLHICEFCTRTFTCSSYLREHVKREHSGTSVQCENCKKNFIQQKNLDLHLVNGICEEERVVYMKEKKKMCSKNKSSPCPHCNVMLASPNKVKRHIEQVHIKGTGMSPKGKSHRCMHCEFHTPFEKKLAKHIELMHPGMYNPYPKCEDVVKKPKKAKNQDQPAAGLYNPYTGGHLLGTQEAKEEKCQPQTSSFYPYGQNIETAKNPEAKEEKDFLHPGIYNPYFQGKE